MTDRKLLNESIPRSSILVFNIIKKERVFRLKHAKKNPKNTANYFATRSIEISYKIYFVLTQNKLILEFLPSIQPMFTDPNTLKNGLNMPTKNSVKFNIYS